MESGVSQTDAARHRQRGGELSTHALVAFLLSASFRPVVGHLTLAPNTAQATTVQRTIYVLGPNLDAYPNRITHLVEVVGDASATIQGHVEPRNEIVTRLTGYLLSRALDELLPAWEGRQRWLLDGMRASTLARKPRTAHLGVVAVSLRFRAPMGVLELQVGRTR